jgi:ribosome-associated toxin RatA of RatAB toxin-antitoxin module
VQGKTKRGIERLLCASVTLPAVFAGILAIAVELPVAAAATISVESERDGDAVDIHAAVVLKADAATAWRVMTDYDHYAEFIPELRLSRIIARRGSTVIVEQSGDATFWLFKVPIDITFEINETPPRRLQSRAVAGSLRALLSSYALTPVSSGTRLDYHGHVEPGFAPFGQIAQTAVERNVARQFQALADEIERQAAKAASQPIAGVK